MYKKTVVIFTILIFFLLFFTSNFVLAQDNRTNNSIEKLEIFYFYSTRCGACKKVKKKVLPKIREKFKNDIEIKYYNILNKNDYKIMLAVSEKLGLSDKEKGLVPKVIVNGKVLVGYSEINEKINRVIKNALIEDKKIFELDSKIASKNGLLLKKFKKFSIWGVVGAGLIDGINPCAFATIIFFISFLGIAGYSRKELINIGVFFIVAVFITYFLLGFGIFNFLFHLEYYNILSKLLYIFIILFTLGVGIINLLDYYNLKRKKILPKDMKLQLPNKIKRLIHKMIGIGYRREDYRDKEKKLAGNYLKLIGITFVVGIIIALLESVCTGQIYLPTISFIASGTKLKFKAVTFLFLYNIAFVLPLILIFILALTGVTSQELARFSRNHLGIIKLITGLLLFVLAAGLYYYIFL